MLEGRGFESIILSALMALALPLHANELETRITLSAEFTDNSLREREEEVSELLLTPTVDIKYLYELSSLKANLDYSFKRQDYRDDTFEDRTDVIGEGTILWAVIDNRMNWTFYHSENRISVNNQLAETPSNEDERTVLRTGPTIKLISRAKSELSIDAWYMESNSENFLDAEMMQGQMDYSRRFGGSIAGGLFYSVSALKSEGDLIDYDSKSYGINVSRRGQNLSLQLQYGRNTLEPGFAGRISGPFFVASLNWVTPDRQLSLKANRELTDSSFGLSLNDNVGSSLENGDGNIGAQDVIERWRHEFSYTEGSGKGELTASLIYDKQSFISLHESENTRTALIRYRYPLSRRVTLTYEYRHQVREFKAADGDDEATDKRHMIGIRYRVNSSWDVQLDLEDENRHLKFGTFRGHDAFTAKLKISCRL